MQRDAVLSAHRWLMNLIRQRSPVVDWTLVDVTLYCPLKIPKSVKELKSRVLREIPMSYCRMLVLDATKTVGAVAGVRVAAAATGNTAVAVVVEKRAATQHTV